MSSDETSFPDITQDVLRPDVIPDVKFNISVDYVMGNMLTRAAASTSVSKSRLVDAAMGWCLDPVSKEIRDEYNIAGRLDYAIRHDTQFPVPISLRIARTRKLDVIQFGSELGHGEDRVLSAIGRTMIGAWFYARSVGPNSSWEIGRFVS